MTVTNVYGTQGSRRATTNETVIVLAGIQGPAGATPAQLVWQGAWDPSVNYSQDDLVGYGGNAWISLQGGNLGQVPASGSAWWDPLVEAPEGIAIENGFEDHWDADYNSRDWTDIAFSPETYDSFSSTWIPARLTLVLNTPGAPSADPVIVYAENERLEIGAAVDDRFVELPHLTPTGLYVFYYDKTGKLQYQLGGLTGIISRYALVAAVYYIGATETIPDIAWTDGTAVVIGDERHGRTMSSRTHQYLHQTRRSAYESGMSPLDVVVDGSGSVLANNQIGMEEGQFWDEDLEHTVPGSAKPYTCPIVWRDGASGEWTFSSNGTDSLVFLRHAFTSGRPSYNQSLGGGAWQRTEVGNNDFCLYHLFAFNGKPYDGGAGYANPPKYYLVMGQAEYATVGQARDGAEVEITQLQVGGLDPLLAEFIPVATFVIEARNVDAYGGRIRSSTSGSFVDWRSGAFGGGAGGVAPHGATHEDGGTDEIDVTGLSGLLADPQTAAAHAASHEDGGADEIDVTDLSGLLADPQTPAAHAASHEDGGADEITIEDLAATSTDTALRLAPDGAGGVTFAAGGGAPSAHAASHEDGGSDEIDVTDLSGLLADPQTPAAHAASHNAPGGADQLADFVGGTAGPPTAGEKGLVPQPPGLNGNPEVLYADGTWGTPNWPTKDISILTRSDFVPTGLTDGTYTKLKGQHSIVDTPGSPDTTLNLVNDQATPGASKVYGTDGGGVKGWQASATPAAHQASHVTGADQIPTFGAAARGLVPVSGGGTVNFLRADGSFAAVPGRTFEKGGVFISPSGARDVVIWRAPYACTVTAVRGFRVGGTGAAVNARKNGSLSHLASDLSLTSASTWQTGGTPQNASYSAGDYLGIRLISIAGTPTEITVQVEFTKA